ncbi:MAG: TPM domain-containing protein [Gammaproteobacteria bacterium]|nr:TPM domain-containing protein [Gammaproteobacteria bacterium]
MHGSAWRRIALAMLGLALFSAARTADAAARYVYPQGHGPYPLPPITRLVNDYTGVLTLKEATWLEKKLDRLERRNGTQIVLLIIPSTGGEPLFDYCQRAFRTWDLGHNGQGNGVLFVITLLDRQWWIATGSGIQGALPDAVVRRVMPETIDPLWTQAAVNEFDHAQVYKALEAGLDVLINRVQNERTSPPNYSIYDETPRAWYGLAILLAGMLAAYGLTRWFRKHPAPTRARAIAYVCVGSIIAVCVYYIALRTTLLENLMQARAGRSAKPAAIESLTLPVVDESHFHIQQLAEPGVFTVIHFASGTCPACRLLDDNLTDFLELRPDVAVKRIELGVTWSPVEAPLRARLNIHTVPFVLLFDPRAKTITTNNLPDPNTLDLLYDWMEAEQMRASGLRRREFNRGEQS